MKSEDLIELQGLVEGLTSRERVSGSKGIAHAKKLVKRFLRENSIGYAEEFFFVEKLMPVKARLFLKGEKEEIEALPLVGSTWGSVEAEAVLVDDVFNTKEELENKLVITKIGGVREDKKARRLRELGAVGMITFLEEIDTTFSGTLNDEQFLAVNLKRSDAYRIAGKRVRLECRTKKQRIKGSNLYFDLGKGVYIYLVAHIDSKPFVEGAIDNAVGVGLLLMLAKELKHAHLRNRVRFLITDCEELGLEGAKFHAENHDLKYVENVINIDSVGWFNPAVIYKDAEGMNGKKLMEKFERHLKELKIDIPFKASRTGKSDHIPFKKAGKETLFLSSNPFTIRHTPLDNYESINWDIVQMWYEVISTFVKVLYRL